MSTEMRKKFKPFTIEVKTLEEAVTLGALLNYAGQAGSSDARITLREPTWVRSVVATNNYDLWRQVYDEIGPSRHYHPNKQIKVDSPDGVVYVWLDDLKKDLEKAGYKMVPTNG